jgi:hypothetical protein
LECKCRTVWHARDDSQLIRDDCKIHGPEGTESKKIAHLKDRHVMVKATYQKKVDNLREHINIALRRDPFHPPDIAKGIIAALQWLKKNNGHGLQSPEDTSARQELMHTYGIDPEEE